MRVVTGAVAVPSEMFHEMLETDRTMRELEWIAVHYREASDEQRAQLERVLDAIEEDALDEQRAWQEVEFADDWVDES